MTRSDLRSFKRKIAALEKEIEAACGMPDDAEVKADQNDDAMANNPVPEAAFHEFDKKASTESKAPVASSKVAEEPKKDDPMPPKAEDKKPEVKAEDKKEDVKDEVKASDEDTDDDWDDADWEDDKKDEVVGGVAENIKDTNDQVIDLVQPAAKGAQPIDVAKHLKTASYRLDKIADYCQKHGQTKLAFEIDKIADVIDTRIDSLSK